MIKVLKYFISNVGRVFIQLKEAFKLLSSIIRWENL